MPAGGFQRTLSTLARTPNHSAASVLAEGIDGPSGVVRGGAIAAFARRKGEPSQRRFLQLFPQLSAAEVAALGDTPKNFRTTLRKMLAEHDGDSSRAACHFITACRAFDEFPPLVSAAIDPRHPGGDAMASTALQLARALHDEIVAYRRAPTGRDPSFARRWALTALVRAVDRYREHHRVELLEAFLLITTTGNHTLTQLLSDPTHPAHDHMVTMLRTTPSIGAIEVLAKLYDDPQTPLPLLEIAAERSDPHFRAHFLQAIGNPPSSRVLQNIQRVKKLLLLEKVADDWFQLSAEAQAVAVQLVVASRFSRRTKLSIIDSFIAKGHPAARLTASEALGYMELPEAITRLENLLSDADPRMVAVAAKALRRHGHTEAIQRLAGLLTHRDEQVRRVARSGLRDFTFLRYVGQFDQLENALRSELGHIVKESDPAYLEGLQREITAATLSRKLRGLQMAAAMRAVDELRDVVILQASHRDAAVRAEALTALVAARGEEVQETLELATKDTNALVRNRATQALGERGTNLPSIGGRPV